MKEIEESQKQKKVTQISMTEQPNPKEQRVHSLLLPFAGSKGTTIIKNINRTFKGRFSPSRKNCVICFIESPLKIMKNAFYFVLKAPFVLKIFKLLS